MCRFLTLSSKKVADGDLSTLIVSKIFNAIKTLI